MNAPYSNHSLVFLHIAKTGGETLYTIIEKNYPASKVYRIDPFDTALAIEQFKQLPSDVRNTYNALVGHVGVGIHEYLSQPAVYISLLRDPIDRCLSSYFYIKNGLISAGLEQEHPLHERVSQMGVEEYLESGIWTGDDNGHTRALARLEEDVPYRQLTNLHLEHAKKNLSLFFPVLGFIDQYDDFLKLLQAAFGWENIQYQRVNVNKKRPPKDALSAAELNIVKKYNELDLELFAFARTLYWDRINELAEAVKSNLIKEHAPLPKPQGSALPKTKLSRAELTHLPKEVAPLFIKGNRYLQNHNFDGAAAMYLQTMRFIPEYALVFNALGYTAQEKGDYEKAILYYQLAIASRLNYSEAYNNLGNVYLIQKKYEESKETFQRAIVCDPSNADAYSGLGYVYQLVGELDKSIESYQAALLQRPDFDMVRINLANVYLKVGKAAEAEIQYRKVLESQPEKPDLLNGLGNALMEKGDPAAAVEFFLKAVQYGDHFAEAYNNLGNVFLLTEQYEDAASAFLLAINSDPTLANAYNGMGDAYFSQGLFDRAAERYKQALIIDPDLSNSFLQLAKTLAILNRSDELTYECKLILQMHPHSAAAHYQVGLSLLSAGEANEAIGYFKDALTLDPKSHPILCSLGAAYQAAGLRSEEAAVFQELLKDHLLINTGSDSH